MKAHRSIYLVTAVLLTLLTMLFTLDVGAQDEPPITPTPTPERFMASVQVESAFTHVLPSNDSELAASVFEDDELEVIGRNLDGRWLEVKRPGRLYNLGWIEVEWLDFEFRPEALPLTDFSTGLIGTATLTEDPGVAVFVLTEMVLRGSPANTGQLLAIIPHSTVVPVLARDWYGSWFQVYYLGYVGWVAEFGVRDVPDLEAIPIAPGLPPPQNVSGVVIIPPELQLAQLYRLRDYVIASRDAAAELALFWEVVRQGTTMPCNPPPFIEEYLYTREDAQQLPELQRYVPRLTTGVDYMNQSIEPLYRCGVMEPDVVDDARADAINARIVFDSTLDIIADIESIILDYGS